LKQFLLAPRKWSLIAVAAIGLRAQKSKIVLVNLLVAVSGQALETSYAKANFPFRDPS
jgi:hypothetical protein